jgi:anti-anti-sigma factor
MVGAAMEGEARGSSLRTEFIPGDGVLVLEGELDVGRRGGAAGFGRRRGRRRRGGRGRDDGQGRGRRGRGLVAGGAHVDDALANAAAATDGTLTIDASRVDFLDSVGLRSILNVTADLSKVGRAMAIVCTPGPVRRLIELTALTGHLALYDSRAAVIAAPPSDASPS